LNVKLDKSKREMYEIEEDQEGDEAEEDLTQQNVIGVGAGGIFSKSVNFIFVRLYINTY
jgi:hypothetical protein